MATFYIDPTAGSGGDGSEGDPFDSWADVTWTAGNTYLQKAGTTFSGGIVVGASGTNGNPITIGRYGDGADPIVTNGSGTGLQSAGVNYINISDFRATGCSSHGMNLRGSNCNFEDLLSDYNGGSGVNINMGVSWSNTNYRRVVCHGNVDHAFGNSGVTASVTISNILFEDCHFGGSTGSGKHGLVMQFLAGASGATMANITVRGGVFSDNTGAGINIRNQHDTYPGASDYYNTNVRIIGATCNDNGAGGITLTRSVGGTVRGCTCNGNGALSTLGGIWFGGCTGFVVEDNYCADNTTPGIDGAGIFDDQYNVNSIVRRNRVYRSAGSSAEAYYSGYGIAVYNTAGSRHQSNLVVGCRHGYWISHASLSDCEIDGMTVIDSELTSISVDNGAADGVVTLVNNCTVGGVYGIDADPRGDGVTLAAESNNNAYGASDANFNGFTPDASDTQVDPQLTADYRMKPSSPLLQAGTFISYAHRDINGVQRPNPPSIGAYDVATMRTNP